MKIWSCKVGEVPDDLVPRGSDLPMRRAVELAFEQVTGQRATFTFSGWSAELTEIERATVERREPNEQESAPVIAEHIEAGAATLWDWMHEDGTRPLWNDPDAPSDEKDATRGCVGMILAATNVPRRERELRQEIASLKACLRVARETSQAVRDEAQVYRDGYRDGRLATAEEIAREMEREFVAGASRPAWMDSSGILTAHSIQQWAAGIARNFKE